MFDREEVEAYRAIPGADPIPDDNCGCGLCQAAAQFDAEDAAERQQDMDDLQQWMGVMGGDFVDYADLPVGPPEGMEIDITTHYEIVALPPEGMSERSGNPFEWMQFDTVADALRAIYLDAVEYANTFPEMTPEVIEDTPDHLAHFLTLERVQRVTVTDTVRDNADA
jgi:hypothetical protein